MKNTYTVYVQNNADNPQYDFRSMKAAKISLAQYDNAILNSSIGFVAIKRDGKLFTGEQVPFAKFKRRGVGVQKQQPSVKTIDKLTPETSTPTAKQVAQDVLDRIDGGMIAGAQAQFIGGQLYVAIAQLHNEQDVQNVVNKTQCRACAKGSLLVSWIGLMDNCNAIQFCNFNNTYPELYPQGLLNIFPVETLEKMECAYESWETSRSKNVSIPSDVAYVYANRYRNYEYGTPRLKAIMTDIVNGTF